MNEHELRIIGMSRSGNHAIIDWLLSQASGRKCFVNCAEPGLNPYGSARPLDDGRSVLANFDLDLAEELRGKFSAKQLLIYSYEDCFLGTIGKPSFEEQLEDFVGPSRWRADVLILRDPYNLFASRLRAGIGEVSNRTALRIWKQHAREFLGRRRYLKRPRVLINYNRWATDRMYRRQLAGHLNLDFRDSSLHDVPAAANGSSFDGRRYHGRAKRMRTHERWKHFMDDETYIALFDDELKILSRKIFGNIGFETSPFTRDANVRLTRSG